MEKYLDENKKTENFNCEIVEVFVCLTFNF